MRWLHALILLILLTLRLSCLFWLKWTWRLLHSLQSLWGNDLLSIVVLQIMGIRNAAWMTVICRHLAIVTAMCHDWLYLWLQLWEQILLWLLLISIRLSSLLRDDVSHILLEISRAHGMCDLRGINFIIARLLNILTCLKDFLATRRKELLAIIIIKCRTLLEQIVIILYVFLLWL